MLWNNVRRELEEADDGVYAVDVITSPYGDEQRIRVCEACGDPWPDRRCNDCGVYVCVRCDPAAVAPEGAEVMDPPHNCRTTD